MRFRNSPLNISNEYDSSIIAVTTLLVVRNRSLSWSDARHGRIPASMVLLRPVLHQLPHHMIILLAFSYYRYAMVSSITTAVDAFHIAIQHNNRIMVKPSSTLIPMHHQYHKQPKRFSLSSKTSKRFMVNFGPYGDYLNRKINDDDDSSNKNSNDDKNNNQKDTKFDPNHLPPHVTSHQNVHNDHHRSNAWLVHQSGSDNFYFYYYYQSEENLTSANDNSSSDDWNNPNPPFPTAVSSSSQNQWIPSSPSSHSLLLQSSDSMDTDVAAGTYRILQIPTTSLKPGGLRLFLVMYVLGATPRVHSKLPLWKVDRPSNDEYVIDLYFHDHSAILSIELVPSVLSAEGGNNDATALLDDDDDDSNHSNISSNNKGGLGMIYIHRIGSSPTFMYRLHEATLLQGLLHELQTCATDPNILFDNRLCTWTNTTILQLQTISSTFPFG